MIDTTKVIQFYSSELSQGQVYTRMKGSMVSKTKAEACIGKAYMEGMLKMYDMMKRGDDVSEIFTGVVK